MTTVTEAIKLLSRDDAREALRRGDIESICADPEIADRFARELCELARRISPGRQWTVGDLRDVLRVAQLGVGSTRVLEGRYFRKSIKEHVVGARRHGAPFTVVVLTIEPSAPSNARPVLLDALVDGLRKEDLVFLYRRRLAVVLPALAHDDVTSVLERIMERVAERNGTSAVERIVGASFPSDRFADERGMLDWAEDQLRDVPYGD